MTRLASLRWVFLGQGTMSAAALGVLGERRPVAVLTGPASMGTKAADLAREQGFDTRVVERLGADPASDHRDLGAIDLGICCGWSERLAATALRWPRIGWLNLHPSRLPQWRGADPIAWQMLAGVRRLGCSVHWMTERYDNGPVVAQGETEPLDVPDRLEALRRCGSLLGTLASEALQQLAADTVLPGAPQDEEAATWCPPLATVPLTDPARASAHQVCSVANAFSPRPGIALTTLPPDQRFICPELGDALAAGDRPGDVRPLGDDGVAVACRDRWVTGELKAGQPAAAAARRA